MTDVLLYRALGLGDFLTALPAYRALRRAFEGPRHVITLAAPAPLRPLAALTGTFDRFAPTDPLRAPVVNRPPAVAVNLHGKGPESHQVLLRTRPGRLIAFGCRPAGVGGPRWRADEHEVARWCRLLRESGITADETLLDLPKPVTPPLIRAATIVHPGAGDPCRRWPVERFAAVAHELAAQGQPVVVTGTAEERALADAVVERAGLASACNLAGRLELDELAALVCAARLVVCGDTGVGHLATAYGVASVLLFSTSSPWTWGPPPDRPRHRVLWRSAVSSPTAPDGPHPRLLAVGVDEVLAEADLATATAG